MDKNEEILKASHPENFQVKVSILECRQLNLGYEDTPNPYVIVKVSRIKCKFISTF